MRKWHADFVIVCVLAFGIVAVLWMGAGSSRRAAFVRKESTPRNARTLPQDVRPGPKYPGGSYEIEPVLRKAYQAYCDSAVPGSVAAGLLKDYAEAHPESPFLAEIYYMLGSLVSTARREGEEPDIGEQIKYYSKAHDLYGRRFNYSNSAAWGTLANRAKGLSGQKEFYEWLVELRDHGTIQSLYSIRRIGETLNGRAPEMPEDALRITLKSMKRNLPIFIDATERNMIQKASRDPAALIDLVQSYPGTKLAEMAKSRLPPTALEQPTDKPARVPE